MGDVTQKWLFRRTSFTFSLKVAGLNTESFREYWSHPEVVFFVGAMKHKHPKFLRRILSRTLSLWPCHSDVQWQLKKLGWFFCESEVNESDYRWAQRAEHFSRGLSSLQSTEFPDNFIHSFSCFIWFLQIRVKRWKRVFLSPILQSHLVQFPILFC